MAVQSDLTIIVTPQVEVLPQISEQLLNRRQGLSGGEVSPDINHPWLTGEIQVHVLFQFFQSHDEV